MCALEVVEFIQVLIVHWVTSLGSFKTVVVVVGFIQVRSVHSSTPGESSCSFRYVGFIHAHSAVFSSGVPMGSLGSFRRALRSEGSYLFVGFIGTRSGGTRVHSRSLGSFHWVHLGSSGSFGCAVVGIILLYWVRSGAPWPSSGSFRLVGFIRSHPGVVVFIRVHWVYSCASWAWSGSFGFIGSILARPGRGQVHSGSLG